MSSCTTCSLKVAMAAKRLRRSARSYTAAVERSQRTWSTLCCTERRSFKRRLDGIKASLRGLAWHDWGLACPVRRFKPRCNPPTYRVCVYISLFFLRSSEPSSDPPNPPSPGGCLPLGSASLISCRTSPRSFCSDVFILGIIFGPTKKITLINH